MSSIWKTVPNCDLVDCSRSMAAAGMAQPGLAGGSNAGGGLNNRTVSGSSETPSTPQHDEIKEVQAMKSSELQRAGREEPMYGPLPRPHGLTSPANSLGTESLVTPITTPEPSGSPRGTLEPSIEAGLQARPVPSPLVQNTYDRQVFKWIVFLFSWILSVFLPKIPLQLLAISKKSCRVPCRLHTSVSVMLEIVSGPPGRIRQGHEYIQHKMAFVYFYNYILCHR